MERPDTALRRSRIAAGMTQRDVAEVLGISDAYLSDMERGVRPIRDEIAFALPEPIGQAVRKALANQHRLAAQKLDPALAP